MSDTGNGRVIQISSGVSSVLSLATSLTAPAAMTIDTAGNLYIYDGGAGSLVEAPVSGSSSVVSRQLGTQGGLATDTLGNVYLTIAAENQVFEVSSTGLRPVAGNGTAGESGDGGTADRAELNNPGALAIAADGTIYIAESGGVRAIAAASIQFNNAGLTNSDMKTFAVSNIGNLADTFGSNFLLAQSPSEFSVNGGNFNDCAAFLGKSFAPGASCNLTVEFTPTGAGTATDTLTLATGSQISLTGNALGDPVTVSSTALSFGSQSVNSTSGPQRVTLTNTSSADATLSSISLTAGANTTSNAFSVWGTTCSSSLAANASCSITLVFSPATASGQSATLGFTDISSATNTYYPKKVTVGGVGVGSNPAGPNNPLVLSTSTLNFGSQLTGVTGTAQSFTLSNGGSAAITLGGFALSGTNSADYAYTTDCSVVLAGASSCSVNVTFTPSLQAAEPASITFTDTLGATPFSQAVALSGAGSAVANPLSLSTSAIDFGNQTAGGQSPQSILFTLVNNGSAPIGLGSFIVAGANGSDFFLYSSCGTTLAAAANCSVSVYFTPSGFGAESARISFTDTLAATTFTQSVAVAGNSVEGPNVLLQSATALNFGNQGIGVTGSVQTVTLTNGQGEFPFSQAAPLTFTGFTLTGANAADFSFSTTCGPYVGINPLASCAVNIRFKPSQAASESATFTFKGTLGLVPFSGTVALTGTGTNALVTGLMSVNVPSLFVDGSDATQSVTLTNSNADAQTISSLSLTGPNASDFAVTSSCGTTVAADSTCTLNVVLTPTVAGNESATLTIASVDAVSGVTSTQTVTLIGTGLSGLPSGIVEILSRESGKAIDVLNLSTANGATIQQYDYLGLPNQQWQFAPDGSGYYTIVNVNSGKVLDDTGYSTDNGTPMQQWASTGADNQKWAVTQQSDGSFTIANKLSGKMLDVTGISDADGALIQQWSATGGSNQKWSIIAAQQYFTITNRLSGKVLDVTGYSKTDGTLLQQWTSGSTGNQQWQFVPLGNGYYQILNHNSGKVLDATDSTGTLPNGALVQQWDYLGGLNQQWQLIPAGNGYFEIANAVNGKVLDVIGLSTENGAGIQVWSYLGNANQQWSLTAVQ